jgi:hypothetical protein
MCHVKLITNFIFHNVKQMFIIHEHENNTMCFELDNVLQQAKHFFLHLSFDDFICYVQQLHQFLELVYKGNEMK